MHNIGSTHWTGWASPTARFNPLTSLPGTKYAWLSGDDLGAAASGIASWPNRANASNNPANASGPAQPLVDAIGARKAALFNGTTSRLNFPTNIVPGTLSIFAAVRPTTIGVTTALLTFDKVNFYTVVSAGVWGMFEGANVFGASALVAGTTYIIEGHVMAANNIDLVQQGTTTNRTTGTALSSRGSSTLGCDLSGTQFCPMRLLELFVCDVLASAADRLAMRQYLNAEYGAF